MNEEKFKVHSDKQDQLIYSRFDETYAITGIQWAKTTSGAHWMRHAMFEYKELGDNFIIAAPTYKIMQQSTLPAFLKIMDGAGEYKAGNAEFKMFNGGTCYMRTGTEPDSVVGITNVRAIWGDEAGKFSLYFWENLIARASFKRARKMFTSTPYTMNWLNNKVLKPYLAGELSDTLIIRAKSCDNPHFPMAEYERRKKTMEARRFNAMYNGEFEKMQGLVYDCFDQETHICDPFQLPMGTKYYASVDWGTTHPFVLLVRGVTPTGYHYQVSEFFQTGLTLMDMIQVAQKLKQVWGIQVFYCDPSQPGYIEEFNRHGLTALPADNDIRRGIDLHYSLLKENKFKLFKDSSPHSVDGYETYHYPEPDDLGPDDANKEPNPVKQDDDAMDATRYGSIMTFRISDIRIPVVPGIKKAHESNEERIKRLKKSNRPGRKTEKWGA